MSPSKAQETWSLTAATVLVLAGRLLILGPIVSRELNQGKPKVSNLSTATSALGPRCGRHRQVAESKFPNVRRAGAMGSGSSLSLCPEGAQTRLYNRIAQNGPSGSYSPERRATTMTDGKSSWRLPILWEGHANAFRLPIFLTSCCKQGTWWLRFANLRTFLPLILLCRSLAKQQNRSLQRVAPHDTLTAFILLSNLPTLRCVSSMAGYIQLCSVMQSANA